MNRRVQRRPGARRDWVGAKYASLFQEGPVPTSIFAHIERFGDAPCFVTSARTWSFQQVTQAADALFAASDLPPTGLAFLEADRTVETLIAYVGAARRGYAVHLLDPTKKDANNALVQRYRPDVLIEPGKRPIVMGPGHGIAPELSILLSTSGSTGTPKLVKLSHNNIAANTASIIEYLGLSQTDVGITSLKPHYSYGLSVVNTHLATGASIVVSDLGADDPAFWTLAAKHGVTNIAGVPHTFEVMHRAQTDFAKLPDLRLLTQAGGRLSPDLVRHFASVGAEHGVDFCVMYGQTEAAPRISWLPPGLAAQAPDSIGRAIPQGKLQVIDQLGKTITTPGQTGELTYQGPNVMVGYAETREDLAFSEAISVLKTGDLAHFDEQGLFYLDGRLSRFVKPYGVRVSLDDVENLLRPEFASIAVTGDDERIVINLGEPLTEHHALAARLTDVLGLPASTFVIVADQPAPRLSSGKVDYKKLLAAHASPERRKTIGRVFLDEALGLLSGRSPRPDSVLQIFQTVLGGRAMGHHSTFREAGGDSLSFMQVFLLLEEYLGAVPAGWDDMTILDLEHCREAAFV